jgi:RNA polymerase sigma-70 factor, ECF subfamily
LEGTFPPSTTSFCMLTLEPAAASIQTGGALSGRLAVLRGGRTGRSMTKAMLHPDTALPFEAEAQAPAARTLEESALIRAAQRGDRDAFEEIVRRYDQDVLRLALQITRRPEDAHDLYQEAFLKVYRNLDRFRFECNFYTWLYRVVTNVCLDHLRRRSSRPEDQAPESQNLTSLADEDFFDRQAHPAPHSNPERALMGKELGARISRAMERLSPRERMVFELKHFQGLRLRVIGEMLGTTEETVKNSLFRATRKLRSNLEAYR